GGGGGPLRRAGSDRRRRRPRGERTRDRGRLRRRAGRPVGAYRAAQQRLALHGPDAEPVLHPRRAAPPPRRRRLPHPRPRSLTTLPSAMTSAARNGTRPGTPREMVASRPAPASTPHAHGGTGPPGPSTATTVPASSTATASAPAARAPSRCGRPRTPVAASCSRSGSTLTRCAPAPSSAPPTAIHHGGHVGGVSASQGTAGSAPNARTYGSQDSAVDFRPRL